MLHVIVCRQECSFEFFSSCVTPSLGVVLCRAVPAAASCHTRWLKAEVSDRHRSGGGGSLRHGATVPCGYITIKQIPQERRREYLHKTVTVCTENYLQAGVICLVRVWMKACSGRCILEPSDGHQCRRD